MTDSELEAWANDLRAVDIERRLRGCAHFLTTTGHRRDAAIRILTDMLQDDQESVIARIWAVNTLSQLGDLLGSGAREASLSAAKSSHPAVRRAALSLLGTLRDPSTVSFIAQFLHDTATDSSAWFEDHSTVSHTAERALAGFDTDEARSCLAAWHRASN